MHSEIYHLAGSSIFDHNSNCDQILSVEIFTNPMKFCLQRLTASVMLFCGFELVVASDPEGPVRCLSYTRKDSFPRENQQSPPAISGDCATKVNDPSVTTRDGGTHASGSPKQLKSDGSLLSRLFKDFRNYFKKRRGQSYHLNQSTTPTEQVDQALNSTGPNRNNHMPAAPEGNEAPSQQDSQPSANPIRQHPQLEAQRVHFYIEEPQ